MFLHNGRLLIADSILDDTTNFGGILSDEDTVQEALDTLDDHLHVAQTITPDGITPDSGTLTITGDLAITTIAAGTSDYDKFLVSDSGTIKFITGVEVLVDIGASATSHRHSAHVLKNDGITPDSGTLTITGALENTGASQFGTPGSNYSGFETDGTLVSVGDAIVFDDLYFEIAPKTTGAGKPTLASFSGNINQYQMDINDITELRPVEIRHDGVPGSPAEIHVHWVSNGSDGTDRGIKWELDYTWANILENGGTTVFAGATTVTVEDQIPASTPDKTHFHTTIVTFTPTGWVIGAHILMSLKRIASVDDPTPDSDPWVLDVGVHYQINTMGSRSILTK